MSISLDNISFCYQPPPANPITTSRWKPYQVPPTSAHIPQRTCLVPSKPGVSDASTPTQSGASETAQSPKNPSGDAGSESARIQAEHGDSRKIVYHERVAVQDISQEQLDEQALLSIQPATSESSESGATEREVPESPGTTSLGPSKDSIEAAWVPHRSAARPTPPICDILSASISRSPSMGVPEDTPDLERALQTESINIEERADDDKGVTPSDHVQSREPTGQSCRACCHLQANIGGPGQFATVFEKSPTREEDRQVKVITENISSSTPYHCEVRNDSWNIENCQAVDGLAKNYPTLASRPIHEPRERQKTRSRRPIEADFPAGYTLAPSDNTTRKELVPSQRREDGNSRPASGEAQEVFGRGILRIQPHGPRNAYVITFLPDVTETQPISSASELCEELSSSTSHAPTKPGNTSTAGSVPGGQKHLPIDPLILSDDEPLGMRDLHQPFSQGDDHELSEAVCSYPDPPPLFCSAQDKRDIVKPRQGEEAQFASPFDDRHGVTVGNHFSRNPATSIHGGRQPKLRKRKPCQVDGRPPKRVQGPHMSAPGENPSAALYTYFQSLPLDERLKFLPWLLDSSLPLNMPTPDLLATGNGEVRPVSRLRQQSESCGLHGSSRKGMPWSSEEKDHLSKLKRDPNLSWSEVERLFSNQFPGRSRGSIQVFWSTTLKNRALQ